MATNKNLSVSFDNSKNAVFPYNWDDVTNACLEYYTGGNYPKLLISGKSATEYKETAWGRYPYDDWTCYLRSSYSPQTLGASNRVLATDTPVNGKTYYYFSSFVVS
jgi:hypothetical protein